MLKQLPNLLTTSRILAVPTILIFWLGGFMEITLLLTLYAVWTDSIDGRLARKLEAVSTRGALLDPVADKFLVMVLFGLLTSKGILPLWIFILSTLRNILQLLSIPILLWWKKIAFHVRPSFPPKLATALSFLIVILGILYEFRFGDLSKQLLHYGILLLCFPLAWLECQILAGYLPRFVEIYLGRNDTFE